MGGKIFQSGGGVALGDGALDRCESTRALLLLTDKIQQLFNFCGIDPFSLEFGFKSFNDGLSELLYIPGNYRNLPTFPQTVQIVP